MILCLGFTALSLSALDEFDLTGTWNWPIPDWSDNAGNNFEWNNYTMEFYHDMMNDWHWYTLYSEDFEEIDRGEFSVQDDVLNLIQNDEIISRFRISDVSGDQERLELLEIQDFPQQTPYRYLVKKGEFLSEICISLNQAGKYRDVIALIEASEGIYMDIPTDLLFEIAYAYGEAGLYEKAVYTYYDVLSREPENEAAQNNLEWCFEMAGDLVIDK